jgi:phage I-like protein
LEKKNVADRKNKFMIDYMIQKDQKITLTEAGQVEEEIQLLRATTIHDPRYGKVEITPLMLKEMVKNFYDHVRGIDLMIDYSHNTDGEAAGWIRSLRLDENNQSLWASVEWTRPGKIALEEKRYLYISADFETNYRDNETLKNYGTVLKGAALTNRPVVKKMAPTITLSEVEMDEILKQIMALLKVESPDGVIAAMERQMTDVKTLEEKVAELEAKMTEEPKEEEVVLEDLEKEGLIAELADLKAKLAKTEKDSEFNVLLSEGKVVEAQRKAYLTNDVKELVKNAQAINLSEQGHGSKGSDHVEGELSFEDKVLKLAEEKMKSDTTLSIVNAQEIAMKELKK